MNRVMEETGDARPGSHGELEAIPVLLDHEVTPTGIVCYREVARSCDCRVSTA
jgi:hypothetical protein